MTLVRFNNPTMRREVMNDSFKHNFMNDFLGNQRDCDLNTEPRYSVEEMDDKFVLELAVPGLSKEDLTIEVENRVLFVKTIEKEDGDARKGIAVHDFAKQFKLSRKVNAEKISAKSEHGILYIELPKVEQEVVKPARAIEIA